MNIEKDTVVSLNYHLTSSDTVGGAETLVEETDKDNPFVFLFGTGDLLPQFENNLQGKKVGDTFDFRIDDINGYGAKHPDNIVNVPIDAFKDDEGIIDTDMVKLGNTLPMHDHEGNKLHGMIEEITDNHVRMDFNHPLAGKHLHFTGSVLEIRNATSEELNHGHVHGPHGHHH